MIKNLIRDNPYIFLTGFVGIALIIFGNRVMLFDFFLNTLQNKIVVISLLLIYGSSAIVCVPLFKFLQQDNYYHELERRTHSMVRIQKRKLVEIGYYDTAGKKHNVKEFFYDDSFEDYVSFNVCQILNSVSKKKMIFYTIMPFLNTYFFVTSVYKLWKN